jgi:hypothetical protein
VRNEFCSHTSHSERKMLCLPPAPYSFTDSRALATMLSNSPKSYASCRSRWTATEKEERLVSRERVGDQLIDDVLQHQFMDPRVAYIHVRNADAGSFIARVDRVFMGD